MTERAPITSLAISAFAVVALASCDSCESGGPVPFGLDGGAASSGASADSPSSGGRGAAPDAPARLAMVTRELPEGAQRVEIEGAPLALEGETLRVLAALDVDGDADRDAIVVTGGTPSQGPRLLFARRDGAAFGAPIELASTPALSGAAGSATCALERAAIRALSDSRLLTELTTTCAEDRESPRVLHAFVLSVEARPRVLETFALRAGPAGATPADSLTLRIEDRDADGHPDLVVDVSLRAEGADTPADVSLVYLDRPAGLARDASEPAARIAALAQEARGLVRRQPARARPLATRALALWEALCREPGRARLEVGGAPGLPCGRSSGAGRALAVLAQAAARTGDPLAALGALERLERAPVSVRDAELDAARSALDALASAELAIREGAAVEAPRERAPRRSALGFLDEDRLLVRASTPRVISLDGGADQPADPSDATLAMVDPSGRHRLIAIERRCAGTVLVIGPIDPLADLSGARRTALVAARRPPPGAPCPDLTPALRADDDGWRALGWAPQGVLVARGTELRVIPVDLEGRPAGDPVVIEPGSAIPAPIAPGHAAADARVYAHATPAGIVVVTLAPERTASFLRPAGWTVPEGAPIDVAISPSGRRVAWISGGRVRWVERAP